MVCYLCLFCGLFCFLLCGEFCVMCVLLFVLFYYNLRCLVVFDLRSCFGLLVYAILRLYVG